MSSEQPTDYIGMGNPDAKILFVGSEKALSASNLAHAPILNHELVLNHKHWFDIVTRHLHKDPFDPSLLSRSGPLAGFNPYSPLLFPSTEAIVRRSGGHTYRGMERLINAYEVHAGLHPTTTIWEKKTHAKSTSSRIFISELSTQVAPNQALAKFDLCRFLSSLRHKFMTGVARDFYQGFDVVVLYCGRNANYVGQKGTKERRAVIRIFNPIAIHAVSPAPAGFEVYSPTTGARIILCRHFAGGFGKVMATAIAGSM